MKRAQIIQTLNIDDYSYNIFLYMCKTKSKATKNIKYTLYLERCKQIIGRIQNIMINQQQKYHFIQNFRSNAINLDIFRNRRKLIVQWSLYQQVKVCQIQKHEKKVEIFRQQAQIDIGEFWKTHPIENDKRQFTLSFPKAQIQFNFFFLFSIDWNTMQNLSREISSQKAIFCYSPKNEKNTNSSAMRTNYQKNIQEICNPQYIVNNFKQKDQTMSRYNDGFGISNYKQSNNQFLTSFSQSQLHQQNNCLVFSNKAQSPTIYFFSQTEQCNKKDSFPNENKKLRQKKSSKKQKKYLKNVLLYVEILLLLLLIFCLGFIIVKIKEEFSQ